MDMMWGMSGMMVFTVLGWLLVIVAIAAGVWWMVRNVGPGRWDDALDILRQRYARGEISRERVAASRPRRLMKRPYPRLSPTPEEEQHIARVMLATEASVLLRR